MNIEQMAQLTNDYISKKSRLENLVKFRNGTKKEVIEDKTQTTRINIDSAYRYYVGEIIINKKELLVFLDKQIENNKRELILLGKRIGVNDYA